MSEQISIPPQNCLKCGSDTGTKIVCDQCFGEFTPSMIKKFDGIYQRTVVELFNNSCVDCGHSAETESGELCADHVEQKLESPMSRYDLAVGICRCSPCHTKRHAGKVKRIPADTKKLPKQTEERANKRKRPGICETCRVLWAMPGKKDCWKCLGKF